IDLGPDRVLPWVNVAEAATLTRRLFEELGLKCFLKTTGGKGLHVVLPVTRRHTWDEVKTFARAVAERMVSAMPDRFIATAGKHHRSGKIFIDYLRNARGSLAVAPYSVRARPRATVATPLSWDELEPKLDPAKFNVLTVPERLDKIGDPWDGYARVRQTLTASSKRLRSA